jgi:hypothetical protein
MAPTMHANEPLAGGSRSAIAACAPTKCHRTLCGSVASWPGVAISFIKEALTWPACFSSTSSDRESQSFSRHTSFYQFSNDHIFLIQRIEEGEEMEYSQELHNEL